jgi:hypothetical protein
VILPGWLVINPVEDQGRTAGLGRGPRRHLGVDTSDEEALKPAMRTRMA